MNPHTDIVRLLRVHPQSLAALQRKTGVSLPTLRKAVQELSDARWVRVVGQAEANGGRPPALFGLDGDYYALIGVHLQLPGMRMATTDLTGRVLHDQRIIHDRVPLPEEVVESISEYVEKVRDVLQGRQLLGIGIASPGFIDPVSNDILLIGRVPGWQNFPICSRVEAVAGVPTSVANDIDCMAFVEFDRTEQALERNLVYIGFDEGVKASLFLEGSPYRGSLGNAGLIASKPLHVEGRDDRAEISEILSVHGFNAVFERRVDQLSPDSGVLYQPIRSAVDPHERFRQIVAADANQFPLCRDVTRLMVQTLAVAVANLIYVVQPDVLVLGGALCNLSPLDVSILEVQIRELLPAIISNHVVIRMSGVTSRNAAAVGAAQMLLEQHIIERDDFLSHTTAGK